MSNVGKTLLAAGLCRIFRQDGYKTVPFKAQNMSLNSCITADGKEMSRAQVMQAEAAGIAPSADMNPLLLKPTGHTGSQIIFRGNVLENMTAAEFYRRKKEFVPGILEAYRCITEDAEIAVIEGAGSPVELNLRKDDLVNMGFAELVDAPVLLIGDIDPGGIFAQLLGTLRLLSEEERSRVRGLIVNKFRGDPELFRDGIRILEESSGLPVLGVVPFTGHSLSDEDSMSDRLKNSGAAGKEKVIYDIAVVRYPHISNFTDFDVFDQWTDMRIRYVTDPAETGRPDMLILPGSKNTIEDMRWLREKGFEPVIKSYSSYGVVFGICGGYQMLGRNIEDPGHTEAGGSIEGLGLLSDRTIIAGKKQQRRTEGAAGQLKGALKELAGCTFSGYEIHMGNTFTDTAEEGLIREEGNIYGTYLHGFFDAPEIIPALRRSLAGLRGLSCDDGEKPDYKEFKEREYDRLAEVLRNSLDINGIYRIMGLR